MKHKVKIRLARRDLPEVEVLTSKSRRISARIAKWLWGDFCEVLILQPGRTVDGIEIKEMPEEVAVNESN